MMLSMTGYGKSLTQLNHKKITVEIRTLNSKNLDLNLRIPSAYKSIELPLRKMAAKELLRGKVDISIHVEKTGSTSAQQLDIPVLNNYIEQLKSVEGVNFAENDVQLLVAASKFPDVFSSMEDDISDEELHTIQETTEKAIDAVTVYRKDEGKVLKQDFSLRISNITSLLDQVIDIDTQRLSGIRTRLEKAVSEIKETLDENRFEQELIFYLEKYDITEEKVRLKNHLNYFNDTISSNTSQGKKLGFICQEIGREINTIGSKANDAELQKIVVQMKDELEKIKEQLLNVL